MKRKNSVGRTSRVFPAVVNIIKLKIQEPMDNLTPKNEHSKNSLLQTQWLSVRSHRLLSIVLLEVSRRDNRIVSWVWKTQERNSLYAACFLILEYLVSISVAQEKTFGSFAEVWRSLWSRSQDAGFDEATVLYQKIVDEEYITSFWFYSLYVDQYMSKGSMAESSMLFEFLVSQKLM